ncbi:hypothetical protein DER44DRAFT_626941, partial [Fusarium oxysporum]
APMADPLSIASGVAGLVSLGLTLCNGLQSYLSAVKDRYSDIETATQGLALLQSNICIIQSSTLKLGRRHALAANGVNLGLRNCETQLKALENFIEDLTTAPSSSEAKQKWQKQKMFIRYPFDQKKLFQLQEQLSKANSTLGSFVQSFNLDLNIGIRDDLQVLKRDIHANDSVTHATLRMISNQLCSISSVGQSTNVGMTTSFTLVDDQPVATNSALDQREIQPLYLRNSEAERAICRNLSTMECTCPNSTNGAVYGRSSHNPSIYRRIWTPRDKNASLFDVDEEGNNVAHQFLETYLYFLNVSEDLQPDDTAAEAICMILSYMFDIGVPVTACNFSQSTVLDISRDRIDYLWAIPRLYGLITDRDPTFRATESGHNQTIDLASTATKAWLQRMNVWAEYPEISADHSAFGFHDIFLAVMQKDKPRLEAILEDGSLPTGMPLRDFHERTVMHVSSTWPTGLSLLLQHKAGRSSLNSIVSESIAPLDCALVHSGMICKEPDQWTLCNDCDCAPSVQILLEADCSVTVGMDRAQTLESCSLKA